MTTLTRWLSLAVLSATVVGCEHRDPNFPSQEELYDVPEAPDVLLVRSEGKFFSVKVGDRDLVGPDVRLSIYSEPTDSAVRGVLWGRPVSLHVGKASASGVVASTPFQLSVRREGNALRAVGSVSWEDSDFTLTREGFKGSVAKCEYDLRRIEPLLYEGQRSCNGPGELVTVQIPEELSRWGDVGSATALALLLSES
jgi:hypothetical protein